MRLRVTQNSLTRLMRNQTQVREAKASLTLSLMKKMKMRLVTLMIRRQRKMMLAKTFSFLKFSRPKKILRKNLKKKETSRFGSTNPRVPLSLVLDKRTPNTSSLSLLLVIIT